MSHHPLQEDVSPSSASLTHHYRHHSDASLAAHLEAASSDKSEGLDEEEKAEVKRDDDDDVDHSPVIQRTDPHHHYHPSGIRTPSSTRPHAHPLPSHRSLTPLPPPNPAAAPSPPPPPLPSSAPAPFALRLMSPPPRSALPISLKNQPTRERQRTIHHLLSQSSGVTSISSPEYEFSEESSTRSQPNTPSHSQRRGERERPAELLFVKESLDATAHPSGPPTSSLTSQIQRAQAPTPPVYRRQGSPRQPSALASPKLKLTVFLPVHELLIQLEVRSTLTSEALIKVVLDIYRRENATNLHPAMLDSVRHYRLFIAEESGRVDEDFPGLDPRAVIGTTAATHFALQHLEGEAGAPRRSPTPSGYHRGSISQSLSEVSGVGGESRRPEEDEKATEGGGSDGRVDGRGSLTPFNVESNSQQSQEALVRVPPWWASLLCCGRAEEDGSDASERRRSTGDSVGGVAVPKARFSLSPEAAPR